MNKDLLDAFRASAQSGYRGEIRTRLSQRLSHSCPSPPVDIHGIGISLFDSPSSLPPIKLCGRCRDSGCCTLYQVILSE